MTKYILNRKVEVRPIRKVLIVCEGEKTEPLYFKAFPINPTVVDAIIVEGAGRNTKSLIEYAHELSQQAVKERTPYREVWCVFDKDSFANDAYDGAVALANSYGFNCAYSNEAFELWYILHFNLCSAALSRDQYKEKLTDALGFEYKKNDPDMYTFLIKRQKTAIRNARKLYNEVKALCPSKQNPVTKVFQLVEQLNG